MVGVLALVEAVTRAAWWEGAGLALAAAGIAGAGGLILGYAVPQFVTWPRQILAVLLGGAAFYWGFQMENFRVTSVSLVDPRSRIGASCPFKLIVSGTVRVGGGKGDVEYVITYPTSPAQTEHDGKLQFTRSSGQKIHDELRLTNKNVGRQGIHDQIQVRTDSPNSKSDVAPLEVKCQRPGFATLIAEGYSATYPAGWRIVQKDKVITTYRRSKFQSPAGDYFVLIDWGADTEPTPFSVYQGCTLKSERRLRLGPHTPTEWVYACQGKTFVTYRFGAAGDSYGVKAGGADFGAAHQVAKRVVESITPR
jgi:hypothetical protein